MATQTIQKFLELLKRSGLVPEDQIVEALADYKRTRQTQPDGDAAPLANFFVERGLITSWHRDQLRRGLWRGFFLGKHKLLRHLGSGGMSHVYLAEHTRLRRLVAIKVLPEKRVNDSTYLARFTLEARAAAGLDHPNIVRVYDIDNDGAFHFIVMEYVDGPNLAQLVKQRGPLTYREAAEYIRQAAAGLQHAHDSGLVHRDVKPANLLLDPRGVIKLLDLGLALVSDDHLASMTIDHDENVLGTADYLAPEQAINSHGVDHRADIYGLGCTFYALLAGRPPFPTGTIAERLMKHQREEPESIASQRNDVPEELIAICNRMMAKDPQRRFQSAADVENALTAFLKTPVHAAARERAAVANGVNAPARPHSPSPAAPQREPSEARPGDTTGFASASPSTIVDPSGTSARAAKRLPVAKPLDDSTFAFARPEGDSYPNLDDYMPHSHIERSSKSVSRKLVAFCVACVAVIGGLVAGLLKVVSLLSSH